MHDKLSTFSEIDLKKESDKQKVIKAISKLSDILFTFIPSSITKENIDIIIKMIRGEELHGSSINEAPIQEAKYEVEEEKEPLHVEMETTSSEVFNFNGSSEMDLTDLLEYIKGKNYNC